MYSYIINYEYISVFEKTFYYYNDDSAKKILLQITILIKW